MKQLLKLVLFTLPILASLAQAQQNQLPYSGWSWGGQIQHITFDDQAAWEAGISDQGTAIGFVAERYTSDSDNTLSLGINFILYNDNDEFAQYVEDYWGDSEYAESDANAILIFAEYGPKYLFGADKLSFFTVRGGISGMLYSERGIGNCSNCYSEDIDIDGGLYGVLGVGRSMGPVDLTLQFQQYFTGDIDNAIQLKISSAF